MRYVLDIAGTMGSAAGQRADGRGFRSFIFQLNLSRSSAVTLTPLTPLTPQANKMCLRRAEKVDECRPLADGAPPALKPPEKKIGIWSIIREVAWLLCGRRWK